MIRPSLALAAAMLLIPLTLGAQPPADTTRALPAMRPWLGDSILGQAPAAGWVRAERGFSVGTLDAARDGIDDAPSLPRALQGRLPGVSVTQGEGFVGSSSRVWLRGPSSVFINEPLVIIDGARTHAALATRGFNLGPLPSRLEDIDPEIIERVEVLRGAAASAIYGPGASKGVILVTTKRGAPGPARWTAFAETGPRTETTGFPANYGTLGVSTSTSQPTDNCPLRAQADGSCTALSRRSWNPLESASPFRTGWSHGGGVGVSGGTGQVTYRAGVGHDRATGVYREGGSSATSATANVRLAATPTLDLRLGGAFRTEDLRLPASDYIILGLGGESVDDPVRRGYGSEDFGALEQSARRDEDGQRVTATLEATWRPRPWLRGSALIGYDRVRSEHLFRRREAGISVPGIPSSGDSVTFLNRTRDTPEARTGTLEAEASYRSLGAAMRSAIGFQYLRDDDRGEAFSGAIPDNSTDPAFSAEEYATLRRITKSLHARQHFAWSRVFLTGTLRVDRPSADLFETIYSPSVDVSWMPISRADRRSPIVGELRLRAAYGRGGGHLIPTLQDSPLGVRPSDETAERMTELELGADLALLDDRLLAQITAYRATNDQGLVDRSPPGGGPPPSYSNDAEFRIGGIEIMLDGRLLERGGLTWDAGVALARQRARTETVFGFPRPVGFAYQMLERGESIGEYHTRPYTWIDQNGDDMIATSEVTLASGDVPSAGSPFPEYEASLHTDVTVGRSVRISALVDRRAGQKLFDQTAAFRCTFLPNCADQHDPATPLADQAAAVAAAGGHVGGYIEDASFTRLREVNLSIALPRQWTGTASAARLSITGRNLYTWTGYSGLDPEIISRDRDSVVAFGGAYQPPLRTFTARLDVSW